MKDITKPTALVCLQDSSLPKNCSTQKIIPTMYHNCHIQCANDGVTKWNDRTEGKCGAHGCQSTIQMVDDSQLKNSQLLCIHGYAAATAVCTKIDKGNFSLQCRKYVASIQ